MESQVPMEQEFQMPRQIEREIRLEDQGATFLYRMRACELEFSGSYIWGKCQISKYKLQKRQERKLESLIPFRLRTVTKESWERIWHVQCERGVFINGREPGKRDGLLDVRNQLVGEFANKGILVSDRMLDMCMSPVERNLLEIQAQILDYGK